MGLTMLFAIASVKTFDETMKRGNLGHHRICQGEHGRAVCRASEKALRESGCDRIFTDHGVSGTRASRPELDKMLDHLRKGDELVIWKLDRLGRNTKNLLELVEQL